MRIGARATGTALFLTMALLTATIRAEQAPPKSPQVALKAAAQQRQTDQKQAIQTLKAAMNAFPDHEQLRHALSLAYLENGNDFWALKVLREYEDLHPPACNTRAFQAWIHIKLANFDLAEEILETPGCNTPAYGNARRLLLKAQIAAQKGERKEVLEYANKAREEGQFYEEDKLLLDAMTARFDPGRIPLASWRIELATGRTTNGLAGSPVDPAGRDDDTSSPVTQINGRLRLVVPTGRLVRPVLEIQIRTLDLSADKVEGLSYRQPSVRAGILVGHTHPRLLLTYGFDAVQIADDDRYGDGPLWYSEVHRFDYELEASDNLFAFGGGGRRWYRESGRTRWEFEQGLAAAFDLTDELRAMAGASARWNRAENRAYDANGGTALAQLSYTLPANLEARLNMSTSYDDYPRSHGYFPGSVDSKRTESQVRIKPGLWSPSWLGLRLGVDWEYSHRDSSVANYVYTDNRFLLHGVWVMDDDRLGIKTIGTKGRQAIPYGTSSGQHEEEMRIRDLMRQDDAVKRGSSCLN